MSLPSRAAVIVERQHVAGVLATSVSPDGANAREQRSQLLAEVAEGLKRDRSSHLLVWMRDKVHGLAGDGEQRQEWRFGAG